MSVIREKIDEICASLWMKPASSEQLKEREFLKTTSLYGIELLLQMAENKNLIYCKGEKYYCFKKTAKELNIKGFELYIKEEYLSEFEKSFRKSNKFK